MRWWQILRSLPVWRQIVYVIATIGALALLVWDIVDQDAQYTTVGFFVLLIIGVIALRAPDRRNT